MGADQLAPKALVADDVKNDSQSSDSLCQLQAELSERKLVQEELYLLNAALELRLTEGAAALAGAQDELRLEMHVRSEDRKEISRLKDDLVRQGNYLDLVTKELESFSYAISHDLRSPLRHILGFSGALLEDYRENLDPSAQGYLDCVVRAGRKMESLIEALLNLSRITRQELTLATVDLTLLARECAVSLKDSDPGRSVVFNIADELSVRADAALLKAAMANLLENAWKYTGKMETATIELGRKQEGDTAVYYVRDNGAGFDLQFADKLFGPFQRMHNENEFEGVGVGLAAVQRIVHRHGGRIWADAAVGGGATFFFTLPD